MGAETVELASETQVPAAAVVAVDTEMLHRQNVFAILRKEEHQSMSRLFHIKQQAAKTFSEQLASLGPRGSVQVQLPLDKGLAGKRTARRAQILDNTSILLAADDSKKALPSEPGLCRVPIKLDLEQDGYKLRDSLLWSLSDPSVSPEDFAAITCEDFELPASIFAPAIVKTIGEQLVDYQDFLGMLRMMGGLKEFAGIRGLIRVHCNISMKIT